MTSSTVTANKQFRGVSIESDWRGCCEAVQAISGQRFLAGEAPMVPLDACSQPGECHCVYKHWSDRREGDRRIPYPGLGSQFHATEDRREGEDRRE